MNIWNLVREQQEYEVKKKKEQPCLCDSYKFPHRRNGGKCIDDGALMTLTEKLEYAARLDKSEKYYS